jgi:hypothetical protein
LIPFELNPFTKSSRRLADYEPILSQIMRLIAKKTDFRSRPPFSDVLARNPRLVVAISHSTPLSWLPAGALLAAHACARGGGQRVPMGVMDRAFFQIPFVKEMAQLITQSERPLSFFELTERFEKAETADLVVFPEGSNCFFGHPDEIQEFRSPKFVEIAIRTKCPIYIVVHRGSEQWAKTIPVNEEQLAKLDVLPDFVYEFLERRLRKTGLLALPVLPKPMEKFEMLGELYQPSLLLEELSEDPAERHDQIRNEAEKVRTRMRELLVELAAEKDCVQI